LLFSRLFASVSDVNREPRDLLDSSPTTGSSRSRWLVTALDRDGALYIGLLLLVWALTVPMRGFWQDDTLLLRRALDFKGHGFMAAFGAMGSPMRRLYTLPFRLALETPQPVWTLHLLFGSVWLAQGLAAGWIARLLLPGQHLTRLLAVCLTLTATSDYLTDNLTALGYNFAALSLLLAVGCALRSLGGRAAGWVALSCLALAISIWTLDLAIPALPFAPVLLLWRGGWQGWRRLLLVVGAWGLTLAPAAPVEWRFLHDPGGYAAVALTPMPLGEHVEAARRLWLENFKPWAWVSNRPVWYPRPPAAIPAWAMVLGSGVAAAWFAFRARRVALAPRQESAARTLSLVGLFALMALASNAAYASLQMAQLHYRTHIVSRTWASLAIAILASWVWQAWPRWRAWPLLGTTAFVGLGVWGGLERQDLWVSTWRQHQRELLSIVTNAPALAPGTAVILRSGSTPDLYLATEADYLSNSWLILLYNAPGIHGLRFAPDRGTGCRPAPHALECWHEGQAGCFANATCAPDRFPYEQLVIMDFDDRDGRYRLLPSLQGDPLFVGSNVVTAKYRPEERILRRPLTPGQRALLLQ
jgi:hypothetical protein